MIPCISIRQPWAWLILHAGKDIENRTWRSLYTGPVFIHAAKTMTKRDWLQACQFVLGLDTGAGTFEPEPKTSIFSRLPFAHTMPRGGIVGMVDITQWVDGYPTRWSAGTGGAMLRNPVAFHRMIPCAGRLGLFRADKEAMETALMFRRIAQERTPWKATPERGAWNGGDR